MCNLGQTDGLRSSSPSSYYSLSLAWRKKASVSNNSLLLPSFRRNFYIFFFFFPFVRSFFILAPLKKKEKWDARLDLTSHPPDRLFFFPPFPFAVSHPLVNFFFFLFFLSLSLCLRLPFKRKKWVRREATTLEKRKTLWLACFYSSPVSRESTSSISESVLSGRAHRGHRLTNQ